MRPFRFATHLSTASSRADLVQHARDAESRGFATITVADHFRPGDIAPLVAMMAMADATDTIDVGSNVLDNDYRHPVVLAKELASFDLLSGGRLQVGLGAGWLLSDYETWGIPIDSPGVRVARLRESVTVLEALWSGRPVTFDVVHYTIDAPAGVAPALQQPHPPLLVGGEGRRMLELSAQDADIVVINFNQRHGAPDAKAIMSDPANCDPRSHDQRIEWVRAAAGDRFESLELAVLAAVQVIDDRERAPSTAAAAQGVTVEWLQEAPQFYFGTVDQIAAEIIETRERWGISYFMTLASDFEVTAQLIEQLVQR